MQNFLTALVIVAQLLVPSRRYSTAEVSQIAWTNGQTIFEFETPSGDLWSYYDRDNVLPNDGNFVLIFDTLGTESDTTDDYVIAAYPVS